MCTLPSLRAAVNRGNEMFRTKQSLQSRLKCNPLLSCDNVTQLLTNHHSLLIQRYQGLNVVQRKISYTHAVIWLSSGVAVTLGGSA